MELQYCCDSVVEWGSKALEEGTFPRDDHRELIELAVLSLGGSVYPFTLGKPGAHHNARFLVLRFIIMMHMFQIFFMSR